MNLRTLRVVVTMLACLAVVNAPAYVLDQASNEDGGELGSVSVHYDFAVRAQIFTAGMSRVLGAIDIGVREVDTPAMVEIMIAGVVGGVPSSDPADVLGSVTVPGDQWENGWNRIAFETEAVSLAAGEEYAMVFRETQKISTANSLLLGIRRDCYAEGSTWWYRADGHAPPTDWTEFSLGGNYYDLQFRTWMVPEPATVLLLAVGAVGALGRRR